MKYCILSLGLALFAPLVAPAADPDRAAKPNVVIIFADDLGYGDLSCYGATQWKTPHLDALAQQGVRFTDFYVAQAVCSASRAALLTGCYPNRVGISGALGPGSRIGLNPEETTIADVAKTRGYATGMVGKWHLGHLPKFLPTRQGFDSYYGLPYSNDMWPHHPEAKPGSYPPLPMYKNEKIVNPNVSAEDQTQLTKDYTTRAVQFIQANKEKPFFLYVAHSMPHVPIFASKAFQGSSHYGLFGDVIQEIDWSVGEIVKTLKTLGLAENTLVIFTSDNGPWLSYGNHAGSAGPLREGKGTAWDGGVREPFIASWPGKIPAGSVCQEPAMTIDLLPTVAAVIGADLPQKKIDGKDITPLLKGTPGAKSPQNAYWFYYKQNELHAVRSGPWKLVLPHTYRSMQGQAPGKDGIPGKYIQKKAEQALYNLQADIGETTDVSAQHPDVVQALLAHAEAARADLGDTLTKRPGPGRRPAGTLK